MKLWQKKTPLDSRIEAFTVGDDPHLDQRLISFDCMASIAHAKMLGKIGILTSLEVEQLEKELNQIIKLADKGKFIIKQHQEDCHTAIENHLTEKLGDLGKKIHTARSRNDQVMAALRLYYKEALPACESSIEDLIAEFRNMVSQYGTIQFPGYTHTRKAMVATISMWANGFEESMADNIKLLRFCVDLINQSPLGTGAGYGVPLDIDREYTACALCFSRIQESPIYVQNSRGKFESTIIHALSQIMFDLNRMANDLILFSMPDFGYFSLPDDFCTGSSIMPQKKNPDVLELIRAKYHTIVSNEVQLKSMTANLISGYHRDFQLTKKPVIESFDITIDCLNMMALIIQNVKVNNDNCQKALTDEVYATEKVYDLVKKGMPFREAYQKVAKKYK